MQSEGVGFDAVRHIGRQRGKKCLARDLNVERGGAQGGVGGFQIRIFAFRHGLDIGEGGKGRGQREIVHDREVLVEIAEQQDRQIQPGVVHRQFCFLESLFLLGVLEVGAYHVATRHFAAAFQALGDVQIAFGLIESLLGRRVLALPGQERVVCPGHRNCQAPPCDFRPRLRQGLGRLRALGTGFGQGGVEILVHHAPFPIHVYAVVGDEPAAGQNPIALRPKVVRLEAGAGTLGRSRLQKILVSQVCVVHRREKLGCVHLRSRKGILQRQSERRRLGQPRRIRGSGRLPVG